MRFGIAIFGCSALALFAQQPAPPQRLVLFDETVKIPRAQWRPHIVTLKQRPATIEIQHQVLDGPAVRVLVVPRADADHLLREEAHRIFAGIEESPKGDLRYSANRPGDYVVVVDNRTGRGPAAVQLRVGVAFDPKFRSFAPRTLPPSRRRVVVALSLLTFAGIGGWSGWRLWKARVGQQGAGGQTSA